MASVFLSDSRNPILFQSSANFTDLFYNPELAFRTGTSIATYFLGARPMRIGVEKYFSSHFLFKAYHPLTANCKFSISQMSMEMEKKT
jgi:hypothetical protein